MLSGWLQAIHTGGVTTVGLGFLLLVTVSFFPVIPIPVIVAVMAAVLPLWSSVIIAWTAVVIGALMKFLLERLLLQRYVQHYLSRYRQWNTVLSIVERHGFIAVLVTRMIPFCPSAVVNLACAITGMRFSVFLAATVIGLFPSVLAFSLAGHQIRHHWGTGVWIALAYILATGIVAWKIRVALRSERKM